MRYRWNWLIVIFLLAGCLPDEEEAGGGEPRVRGLKTIVVEETDPNITRRFPSVLQPAEVTAVSFEIGGRLGDMPLTVGQKVSMGDVLAMLDGTTLELQIATAESELARARSAADVAAGALVRQKGLFSQGLVTKVALDNAEVEATSTAEAVVQAERALDRAQEDLAKVQLVAPFDGVVSSVDVQPFATISAGSPIVTLYRSEDYEVRFTVNFDVVNRLVVGKPATLRLADAPGRSFGGVVTEVGARAETVASFPVVVTLHDPPADVKAGMAVEVSLSFELEGTVGLTIPLSAAVIADAPEGVPKPDDPVQISVFVFDPDTSTVIMREVTVAGVRENSLLVIDGLEPGERVASAGVSFLTDGQKVKLLEDR